MISFIRLLAVAIVALNFSDTVFAQSAPEMKVAEAGSPEAMRLAALRADAQAGRIPVYRLGGQLTPELLAPNPIPPVIGTRIVPNPEAKGELLRFQQMFVKSFAAQDVPTAGRIAHFSWIPKYDHVRQLGWSGVVKAVVPQADGSVLVSVRISPYLASPHIKTLVVDYVTEIYVVSDGQIVLLDSDAAIPKRNLQNFPVH